MRLRKITNGVVTYFFSAFYTVTASDTQRHYFFNGMRVAERKTSVGTAPIYRYGDQVDSSIYTSHDNTDLNERYYAYGKTRSGAVETEYTFTGQMEDVSGLRYYNARYYDPNIGLFISPDTLIPDPLQLMDYNRYLYAGGNPLKYNDPTGHASECQPDCSPHPILVGCQGSATCVRTEAGQFLLAHQDFDPFVDPYLGQHADYTEIFRMLAQIHLDNGNQELANLYGMVTNAVIAPDALIDGLAAGSAIVTGAAFAGARYHSIYSDGTLVIRGQQPPRLGTASPDPLATGAHSRVRYDTVNGRIYQLRTFDENGVPIADIDFTSPTQPNGVIYEGHTPPPSVQVWTPNATGGTMQRSKTSIPLLDWFFETFGR